MYESGVSARGERLSVSHGAPPPSTAKSLRHRRTAGRNRTTKLRPAVSLPTDDYLGGKKDVGCEFVDLCGDICTQQRECDHRARCDKRASDRVHDHRQAFLVLQKSENKVLHFRYLKSGVVTKFPLHLPWPVGRPERWLSAGRCNASKPSPTERCRYICAEGQDFCAFLTKVGRKRYLNRATLMGAGLAKALLLRAPTKVGI